MNDSQALDLAITYTKINYYAFIYGGIIFFIIALLWLFAQYYKTYIEPKQKPKQWWKL